MSRFKPSEENNRHVSEVWRTGTYKQCTHCGAPRKSGDFPPRGWVMSIYYGDDSYEFTPHLGNCTKKGVIGR